MLDILLRASHYPFEFFLCIVIALFPMGIWMAIFLNKAEKDPFHIILTFFFGMLSAGAVLLYQSFWGDGPINFIFFGVEAYNFKTNIASLVVGSLLVPFFTYMCVGFLEEVLKHYAVIKADTKIISSIGEAIELSIVAALGFAFLENIAYFYREFLQSGITKEFWTLAIQRSIFVVFVHVLCSAIYGYYYGLGLFAKPYMEYEISKHKKTFFIANLLHKILHLKRARIFRQRMAITGLVVATILHGLYDFAMHTNPHVFQYTNSFGSLVSIQLHVILLPIMLVGGMLYLTYLLRQKEIIEEFGTVEVEYTYKRMDEHEANIIQQNYDITPRLSRMQKTA